MEIPNQYIANVWNKKRFVSTPRQWKHKAISLTFWPVPNTNGCFQKKRLLHGLIQKAKKIFEIIKCIPLLHCTVFFATLVKNKYKGIP